MTKSKRYPAPHRPMGLDIRHPKNGEVAHLLRSEEAPYARQYALCGFSSLSTLWLTGDGGLPLCPSCSTVRSAFQAH